MLRTGEDAAFGPPSPNAISVALGVTSWLFANNIPAPLACCVKASVNYHLPI